MKLKSLFVILIASITICSCSSSDDENDLGSVSTINVILDISKISAKEATISYTGEFINESNLDLFYAIKKKETSTYKYYPLKSDFKIDGLNPLTIYQIKIVYKNRNGEYNNTISDKEFFTPSLFQLTQVNSEVDKKGEYIYSHEGFSHILNKSDLNIDTSEIYLVNVNNSQDSIRALETKIFEDRIEFKIPESIVSNEPYEYFRDYYIGVKSGVSYHYISSYDQDTVGTNLLSTKIRVFNKTPYIRSIFRKDFGSTSGCESAAYDIVFHGYFLTTARFFGGIDSYFTPGLTEISDAIITRISDGKEYLVQDQLTDHLENCLAYDRDFRPLSANAPGLPTYHFAQIAFLQIPLSETADITKGDYKVKFTFSINDEFYETNEFPFTLD
jgi:hypothetical protein